MRAAGSGDSAVVAGRAGGAGLPLVAVFQPFAGDGGDRVRVTRSRKRSASARSPTPRRADDVIASPPLFEVRATLSGHRDSLKPGVYYLREDSPFGDVLDRLSTGPGNELIQLTIPEGLSRREVAPVVGRAGVRGDYVQATGRVRAACHAGVRVGERMQRSRGPHVPGHLRAAARRAAPTLVAEAGGCVRAELRRRRPLLRAPQEPDSLRRAEDRLDGRARGAARPRAASGGGGDLQPPQAGQPLGIDATIRYATGNWTEPLTQSELSGDSPYNTRTRAGLPPTPIGNPGLASLRAAARPAKVDYLYYVVKPGTCGQHAFSTTFEQFQKDQQRYNAARDAAGGNSPTTCPTGCDRRLGPGGLAILGHSA